MSNAELIKNTMKILAIRKTGNLPFDGETNQLISEITSLETKLDEFLNEYEDDILQIIQISDMTDTIVSVSYDDEFLSVCNSIIEFAGLYFCDGTDLEMQGPFKSLSNAWHSHVELFNKGPDGYANIYVRSDVSERTVRQLLEAYKDCEVTLSNENGELQLPN